VRYGSPPRHVVAALADDHFEDLDTRQDHVFVDAAVVIVPDQRHVGTVASHQPRDDLQVRVAAAVVFAAAHHVVVGEDLRAARVMAPQRIGDDLANQLGSSLSPDLSL